MNKFKIFSSILLFTFLASCGGGSGSDGGTGTGTTSISIPADAVTITSANTTSIAASAVSTFDSTTTIIGVQASLPSPYAAIETITNIAFNKNKIPSSVASGIVEVFNCTYGGTESDNYTETSGGGSGVITFNQCNYGDGMVLNGSFSYRYIWNSNTGAYTETGNGRITISSSGEAFTLALNYSDTGNDFSGDSSISISFSITGSSLGGFMVNSTQPLISLNFNYASSGQLIVSGANNTRLRITITSISTASVEFDNGDGNFVFHSNIII